MLVLGGLLITLGAVQLMSACEGRVFEEPMQLGGVMVTAETLNQGYRAYQQLCVACHGRNGEARTGAGQSMDPPARDFTSGYFKFKSTPDDDLPTDEDLLRTIQHGLLGTQMNNFANVDEARLRAVIQYIKTFSPRWASEMPGEPLLVEEDPWIGTRRQEGVARGELVFHGQAQCWTCHPAYVSRDEILRATSIYATEVGEAVPSSVPLRSNLSTAEIVETEYGRVLPPDFLSDISRAGRSLTDLYRTIGAGIGGTPMPSWCRDLSASDLWAVVHYVSDLMHARDTPRASLIRSQRGY